MRRPPASRKPTKSAAASCASRMRSVGGRPARWRNAAARDVRSRRTSAPRTELPAGLRRLRQLVQIVDVEHCRLVEAGDLLRVLAVDQVPLVWRMCCAARANAEAHGGLLQRRGGGEEARALAPRARV